MARRYRTNRIKSHRSYEIEEVADLVGVTPQTVRIWIQQGLPALTEKRPYLILGWQLKAFLKSREKDRKKPLLTGEFYCLGCKAPRSAALGLIEHIPLENGRMMLRAFCEVCEQPCNRFVGKHAEAK